MRTCVVCRARREDTLMSRVARDGDGRWYVGRGRGRGAWWCSASDCASQLRVGHLARALGVVVEGRDAEVLLALCSAGQELAGSAVVEE